MAPVWVPFRSGNYSWRRDRLLGEAKSYYFPDRSTHRVHDPVIREWFDIDNQRRMQVRPFIRNIRRRFGWHRYDCIFFLTANIYAVRSMRLSTSETIAH